MNNEITDKKLNDIALSNSINPPPTGDIMPQATQYRSMWNDT